MYSMYIPTFPLVGLITKWIRSMDYLGYGRGYLLVLLYQVNQVSTRPHNSLKVSFMLSFKKIQTSFNLFYYVQLR